MKTKFWLLIFLAFFLNLDVHARNGSEIHKDLDISSELSEFIDKSMSIRFKFFQSQYSKEDYERFLREVDDLLIDDENKSKPLIWLIRGNLLRALAGLRTSVLQEDNVSREEIFDDEIRAGYISKFNESYKEAVTLSGQTGSNNGLTINQLEVITRDVLTNADTKVLAIRKQLSLWRSGKRFEIPEGVEVDPVINFEYDAYSMMSTAYLDENRYDEALAVLNEMQAQLPHKQKEIEQARASILNRKSNYQKKLAQEQEQKITAEKKSPAVTQQQPKSTVQSINPPTDSYGSGEAEYKRYILISSLLLICVAVILYIIRRPPK